MEPKAGMDLDKLMDGTGRLLLLGEPPVPFARDKGNGSGKQFHKFP